MKKLSFLIAAVALTLISCKSSKSDGGDNKGAADSLATIAETVGGVKGKVLVTYFSVPETDGVDAVSSASRVEVGGGMTSNTRYVAQVIADATDGDLFEIKTERTYPASHKALIEAAQEEHDSNARPKLATHIGNLQDYAIIFVGFPIWCWDMPMAIYSFFDEYDFTGKTIIPFTTHAGSGLEGSVEKIAELESGATVIKGYAVHRDRIATSKDGIMNWLKEIAMK